MTTRTKTIKVNVTRDYRLFGRNAENRALNLKKHKRLYWSMKTYGFLKSFPICCIRDAKGHLIVKDGQHRLAIAEELGLPVYWIEEDTDFDVAKINSTPIIWHPRDHAEKYALQGLEAYREGLEFCDIHHLPIGTAFALLGGTTSWGNVSDAFYAGEFVIKDRDYADSVAAVYGPLVRLAPLIRNARLIEACMAVCRVAEFDVKRLVQNAERCRDKLVSYSTREAYLDMLEEVYNFGRKTLLGLKAEATMAMRTRNCISSNDKN